MKKPINTHRSFGHYHIKKSVIYEFKILQAIFMIIIKITSWKEDIFGKFLYVIYIKVFLNTWDFMIKSNFCDIK